MQTAIIFDLDGTLLDTSEGIFETANHTMRTLGLEELTEAQLRKFIGPPLAACFRIVCGFSEEETSHAVKLYRTHFVEEKALYKATIYPGIVELLETLKQRNIEMGVATLKLEKLAVDILDHFNLLPYFTSLSGADPEGKRSKGQLIEFVLKEMGIKDRSKVIMIGDTPHDQIGSKEAQVPFVGVDWGFGFAKGHNVIDEPHVLGFIDEPEALLGYL